MNKNKDWKDGNILVTKTRGEYIVKGKRAYNIKDSNCFIESEDYDDNLKATCGRVYWKDTYDIVAIKTIRPEVKYVYIVTGKVPYSGDTRHALKSFSSSEKAWAYIEEEKKNDYYYDFDVMDCEFES